MFANILMFVIVVFFCFNSTVYPYSLDAKWLTRTQPDGTVFYGHEYCDHFEAYSETKEYYKYVYSPQAGYYHYAIIGEDGNYSPSEYKVGIDYPGGIAPNLQLPSWKRQEINDAREKEGLLYEEKVETLFPLLRANKSASIETETITVDIVLIEFADIEGDTTYTISDFENMYFQQNGYAHPDGEATHGSCRDYWDIVSNGNLILTGSVLNPDADSDGIPEWITLPYNKNYYNTNYTYTQVLNTIFHNAAVNAGLNVTGSATRKICYIYAGNLYDGNHGLQPCGTIGGQHYQISEKTDSDPTRFIRNRDDTDYPTFTHIGLHCHELGHTFGFSHPEEDIDLNSPKFWCIMKNGNSNGSRIGNSPADMNPIYKNYKGWISYSQVTGTTINKTLNSGTAYKLHENNQLFDIIIEHKKAEGVFGDSLFVTDEYLSPSEMGLFIWRRRLSDTSAVQLLVEDGNPTEYFGDDAFGHDYTTISDYTSPSLAPYGTMVDTVHICIDNITPYTNYTTADIYINQWEGTISGNKSFYDDVSVADNTTLTLGSGVTASIAAGKKFDVYGTLVLNSGSNITKLSGSNWGYLDINSGANLTMNSNSTVEYGSGVLLYGDATFPASECYIQNCTGGIYVMSGSPTISYVKFYDNDNIGVSTQSASCCPTITYCTIDGNSNTTYAAALSSTSSDLDIDHSILQNTSSHNINIYYSGASLGVNYAYNDFYPGSNKAIKNCSGVYLSAYANYWGTSSPVGSDIFYYPNYVNWQAIYCSSPNDYGSSKIAIAETDPLRDAIDTYLSDNWKSALEMFYAIISENENASYKRIAIKKILQINKDHAISCDRIRDAISDELETAESIYKASLDYLFCESYLVDGNIDVAKEEFARQATRYKGTSMEVEMLSRLAVIQADYYNDKDAALEYANLAAAVNPGQPVLMGAYYAADVEYDPKQYNDIFIGVNEEFDIPDEPSQPEMELVDNTV